MRDIHSSLDEIRPIIEEQFEEHSEEFDPENPSVRLAYPPYGSEEVLEALGAMLSTYVTMGDKVREFEKKWSEYIGTEHGVMTNSGSSANLISLKALEEDFSEDAEVIVPAVGWSTTVFPIIDAGAKPVFVDVDAENFRISEESIRSAITDKTEAVVVIHMLGNPAAMDAITEICEEHDLALIEDCCEAHGAEFKGRKVGTFGEFATFSFSFSHHISTIEGGIAVTDSVDKRRKMRMLRSYGWVRDVESNDQTKEQELDTDMRFHFASHGYNVRPTEIQGAFGIHQVEKIEEVVERRRDHAEYLNEHLSPIEDIDLMEERSGTRCSYLHYPVLISQESNYSRDELRSYLEENGIETRPILSGDITRHPAFQTDKVRVHGDLTNTDHIHENGLYISNHQSLTQEHLDYVISTVRSFFS